MGRARETRSRAIGNLLPAAVGIAPSPIPIVLNPKNLALAATGAAAIAQAGLSSSEDAVAVAVFVALASVTVVGLVAFYLVATHKADRALSSIKDFMAPHNAVIMMVILLVLGAMLLGQGLGSATS